MERQTLEQRTGNQERLNQLLFSDLSVSDEIVIKTESGSVYQITIIESEDGKIIGSLVEVDDKSKVGLDTDGQEEVQEPAETLELRGSCGVLASSAAGIDGRKPTAGDIEEGVFRRGSCACFEFEKEGSADSVVTMPVTEITLTRHMAPEHKATELIREIVVDGKLPPLKELSELEQSVLVKKLVGAILTIEGVLGEMPRKALITAAWEGIANYHREDHMGQIMWGEKTEDVKALERAKDRRLSLLTKKERELAISRANDWLDENFEK